MDWQKPVNYFWIDSLNSPEFYPRNGQISLRLPEPIYRTNLEIGLVAVSISIPDTEPPAKIPNFYLACSQIEHSLVGTKILPILGLCGSLDGHRLYVEFKNVIMKRLACRSFNNLHCQFVTGDNESIDLPKDCRVSLCIKILHAI